MEQQQLIETYNIVCDTNDKQIQTGEKIKAQCIIFTQEGETKTYDFDLTPKNKEAIALQLKATILKRGAKGYILIFDTVTQKKSKKTNMTITSSCILRTLYTPSTRLREYVWYSGVEIVGKDKLNYRDMMHDEWDAWNTGSMTVDKGPKKPKKDEAKIALKDVFKNLGLPYDEDETFEEE